MKYLYGAIVGATSNGFGIAAHFLVGDTTYSWVKALAVGAAAGVGAIAAMKLAKKLVQLQE
jgi:hypothetical protein